MRARGRHVFKLTWVLFCFKRVSMMVATNVQTSHETTSAYVKRRNNDTDHTHHHHTYMYNKISFARTIPFPCGCVRAPMQSTHLLFPGVVATIIELSALRGSGEVTTPVGGSFLTIGTRFACPRCACVWQGEVSVWVRSFEVYGSTLLHHTRQRG